MLVSAAGDSVVILWQDCTKADREAALKKSEEQLQQEQQLANLLQQGKLLEALVVAVRLDQPFRTLNILKGTVDNILFFPFGFHRVSFFFLNFI